MDTKALRQKILDLAIRGKLVPQDPNDEPASVLLERIHAEKQQMVKDGKLKPKDIKNDTVIFKGDDNLHYEKFSDGTVKCIEDEIPFELPNGWIWNRGHSCFKGMKSLKPQGKYFDYIDIDAIDNKLHKISAAKHLLVKEAPSRASRKLENGSVLFSFVRPYLENIAFVNEKFSHCIASTGFYVCNSNGILNPNFMFVLMTSKYVIDGLNSFMKGNNSPSIRKEEIENFLYPIPPIYEQKRIINKINAMFPIIENLAIQKNNLKKESISFKSKILDLAIRGKLVPQDPNDEPASVLLERIRAEKEELIKQGKIKRNKKESVIFKGSDNSYYEKIGNNIICIDDEIPFETPINWQWVRLGSTVRIERGGSPRPIKSYITTDSNGINWIKIGDVDKDGKYITNTKEKIKPTGIKKSKEVYPGDFLLTNSMSFGRPYISKIYGCVHDGWLVLRNPDVVFDINFLYYLLSSTYLYNQFVIKASGSTVDNLNIDKVSSALICLPPLKEQTMIVNQIEKIIRLIQPFEELL